MTGPHQLIIARLTSGGHGAAAWTMCRSDDTSYFAFTSSGRASSRTNWVGTMWVFVTRYRSMSSSIPSGVQWSITTTVWPMWIAPPAKTRTAVWYSGDPQMWTLSSKGCKPNRNSIPPNPDTIASGATPGSGRRTPFGAPGRAGRVVHDRAGRAVRRRCRRLPVLQVRVRHEAGNVAADGEASRGREVDLVGRGARRVGEAGVGHERLRLAVPHDVGDLRADEVPVDRDEVEAGLQHREVELEDLARVGEQHRDGITGLEAGSSQAVHDLVGAGGQLPGPHLVAVGVDEGQLVGRAVRRWPRTPAAAARRGRRSWSRVAPACSGG